MKNSLPTVIVILLLVIITTWCDTDSQLPLILLENNCNSFAYEYRFPECADKGFFLIDYVCKTQVTHQLKYYCSAQQSETVKNTARRYCLYPHELSFVKPTCPNDVPVEPEITPVNGSEGNSIKCGKNQNNKLYKFGYKICAKEQNENDDNFFHMIIYEFCFNEVSKKVIYVDYRIISPNIPNEIDSQNNSTFKSDISDDDFDIEEFSRFEFIKNAHVKQNDMDRTELIPPSHMALSHWKKPLYHEVNIKLMKSVFLVQWYHINNIIKAEAKKHYGEIRIKTGVFDSSESEVDANIWWKLVYDSEEKHAIAIILHNTDKPPSKGERKCECICDTAKWRDIIFKDMRDYVYCCPPETIAKDMGFSSDVKVFKSPLEKSLRYCSNEVGTPQIIRSSMLNETDKVLCGKDDVGISHAVVFQINMAHHSHFQKIYGFCMHAKTKKIIYVDYKTISLKSLENDHTEMEEKFSTQKRYFQALRKDNFSNKISPMIRKMLIPSSHMDMFICKRAFAEFDYNYDYLHHTRAEELDIIEDYIKQKALTMLGEVSIKAGVMDSPDPSVKTKIWWKLVYDKEETNAMAIIIHNTDTYEERGDKLCETSVCILNGWEFTSLKILKGLNKMLYCCQPDVITRRMGLPDAQILNLNQPKKVDDVEGIKT